MIPYTAKHYIIIYIRYMCGGYTYTHENHKYSAATK